MAKTVILADNHPMFRAGVRNIIMESELFTVVGEAADGESCFYQVSSLRPDILIVDLNMPMLNGFEVVEKLRSEGIECRIIVLSMHSSSDFASYAEKVGCNGFVAKVDASLELLSIMNSEADKFLASSSVGREEEEFALPDVNSQSSEVDLQVLTATEQLVLKHIANSLSSAKIADLIGVSIRTIDTHRQNISKKLNISGANSLLKYALERRSDIEKL